MSDQTLGTSVGDTMTNAAPVILPEPLTESLQRRVEAIGAHLESLPPAQSSRLLNAFTDFVDVLERGGSVAEADQAGRKYLDLHPAETVTRAAEEGRTDEHS